MRVPILCFVYNRKHIATSRKPATIEMRVSYENRKKYISTGVRVLPREWHNGTITNRPDAAELNKALQKMQVNVLKVINQMMDEGCINITDIPDRLDRMRMGGMTFIDFCYKRIEVRKYGRAEDTQERYDRFMRFFSKWGQITYFSDITDRNIMAMDELLKAKKMKVYSKWNNYHRFLNSFINDAKDAGLIDRNPYKWLNIEKGKESGSLQKYLTLEEMHALEKAKMGTESLEHVRDLFVFQTYTCLAYTDLVNFDLSKGKKRPDGRIIYTGKRGKTGQTFTFLILKPAMRILKKYNNRLPIISNINYNKYLKVVAQTAGIDKPITSHWARHTGATILLNEGVDMETVAKILGHSSTRITRSTYAKLLDDTVARKMKEVEGKIENI